MVVTKAADHSAATEGTAEEEAIGGPAVCVAPRSSSCRSGGRDGLPAARTPSPLLSRGTRLSMAAAPLSQENPRGGAQWGWGLDGGGEEDTPVREVTGDQVGRQEERRQNEEVQDEGRGLPRTPG